MNQTKTPAEKALSEAANKVSVARYQMVQETPFFGIISSNLKIIPVSERLKGRIRTAAVTPTGICMYNPDFVNELSFKEVKGLLAHEALHPALGFWSRFRLRDIKLANKAHDYAINVPIEDSPDMDLPNGGLYNVDFREKSAEEIFFILEEEEKRKEEQKEKGDGDPSDDSGEGDSQGEPSDDSSEGSGSGSGKGDPSDDESDDSQGDGKDKSSQGDNYTLEDDVDDEIIDEIEKEYYNEARGKEMSDDELSEIRQTAEQQWTDTIQQAYVADKADGRGSLPAWMVAEIEGILFPKMDFRKLLKRFFGKFGNPARPSFKHRNQRNTFLSNTFVKPKLVKSLPKLYMLIDTSGSMWDEEGYRMAQGALGLVKRLASNEQYEIVIIMADTCVKEEMSFQDVMKAVKDKKLSSIGGGGSCFKSAFERIWELAAQDNLGQAPILCITDGHIGVPDKQASMQTATAWITPPNVNPPTTAWGEHMEMKLP